MTSFDGAQIPSALIESFPHPSPPEASEPDLVEIDFIPESPRFDPAPVTEIPLSSDRGNNSTAKQSKFRFDGEALKSTIIKKLLDHGRADQAEPLIKCHTTLWRKMCTGCRKVSAYYNRCENFYCPCCAPRLARDRRESVEWWTKTIKQPKHVVLTVQNVQTISKGYIQWFKSCWNKLRRRKFAKGWTGGFYSLEITNEGKGWHLHLHALVDARWIDGGQLAVEWADIVGQRFAIVKVKDAREGSYLKELAKYVCDGNAIARWEPKDISAFITAFQGVRTFGVFGQLFNLRSEFSAFLDTLQHDKDTCPCGCSQFKFYDPDSWEWYEQTTGSIPPPQASPRQIPDHPELPMTIPTTTAIDAMRR